MLIELPNTITSLYFCGDLHGNLEYLRYIISSQHLTNSAIIVCGDVGIGFSVDGEKQVIDYINKKLVLVNCYVICFRGNHDNPEYFNNTSLYKENGKPINWLNVPDYSVINVCNLNILGVGGGISIDREWRKTLSKKCYWEDETIKYQPKLDIRIDIIVSHSAPSFAYPIGIGGIVEHYALNDPTLKSDIEIERATLDKVYQDYKDDITHWYYGHYHSTQYQVLDGVVFKLLDISELVRHVTDNDLLSNTSN